MSRAFVAASTHHLLVSAAPVTAVPLTLACWFYASDITTERCLMSISDGSNDNAWFRLDLRGDVAGDPISARTRNGSGSDRRADSTTGYTTNTWYHGCAVFSATNSRTIYLNGGSNATNTQSATPASLTTTTIGKRSSANSALMNGRIAHAALWNVALTAAEALQLASGVAPSMIRPRSLKGYWPLIGNSPETDYSGLKNNMTVTGATVADNPRVAPWYPYTNFSAYAVTATPPASLITRKLLIGVGR